MKYLKHFEAFAGPTAPLAPAHLFAKYYVCKSCKEAFPVVGTADACLACGKSTLQEITEGQYFAYMKQKFPGEDIFRRREEMRDDIIPLAFLSHEDDNYGYDD